MRFEKGFALFKSVVYALLAFNVFLFFRHATFHEGLDAAAWVLLLAVFEWETRRGAKAPGERERWVLLAAELLAYAVIVYAWGQYYLHRQQLDFLNASLWLAVILTITLDIYRQDNLLSRRRWLHRGLKTALYAGLVLIAVLWGAQGELLNFYDAALWIVCFFAIELNLIHHARRAWAEFTYPRAAAAGTASPESARR